MVRSRGHSCMNSLNMISLLHDQEQEPQLSVTITLWIRMPVPSCVYTYIHNTWPFEVVATADMLLFSHKSDPFRSDLASCAFFHADPRLLLV